MLSSPSIQSHYLLQLLRVHKALERPRNKEWITNVLSLMAGCVGGLQGGWALESASSDGKGETAELAEFVDGLRAAGATLDKGTYILRRSEPRWLVLTDGSHLGSHRIADAQPWRVFDSSSI